MRLIIGSFFILFFLNSIIWAYPEDLSTKPQKYDNKIIYLEAEVVGKMIRKEGYWLNLWDKDRDISLGVWFPHEIVPSIRFIGGYKEKGDTLLIKGVFHNHCPQHAGEADIHALEVLKIKEGRKIPEFIPPQKKRLSAFMGGLSLVLWSLQFLREKQRKKSKTPEL